MNQKIERQPGRAENAGEREEGATVLPFAPRRPQEDERGWFGLLGDVVAEWVTDRRGALLWTLAGLVLLLAAFYGPPILIGVEPQ